MAKDVADHQLAAVGLGRGDDAFGIGDGGRQRLFDEYMRTLFERRHRIVGMAVRIGVDRGEIGLEVAQRRGEIGQDGVAGQRRIEPRRRSG